MSEAENIDGAARRLYDECDGNARKLALLAAQYQVLAQRESPGTIAVLAGISADGIPFVQTNVGDALLMHEPQGARDLALSLVDASYWAEADALLFSFAKQNLGCSDDEAMQMVMRTREDEQPKGRGGNGAAAQ